MIRHLETEITIEASPATVWDALMAFTAYGTWNPFIVGIEGAAVAGATLTVQLQPPGGRITTMKPVVTEAVAGEVFEWLGSLPIPGLFTGRHRFELHRTATGTRFVQREDFTGVLVPVLGRLLRTTGRGFGAMNDALKVHVERAAVPGR